MDCDHDFYVTRIMSSEKWGDYQQLAFRVIQQNHPSIRTVYQPMEDFYTFALLVLSCFGVWLGLSLADLNPVKLLNRINQRGSNRSTRITWLQ